MFLFSLLLWNFSLFVTLLIKIFSNGCGNKIPSKILFPINFPTQNCNKEKSEIKGLKGEGTKQEQNQRHQISTKQKTDVMKILQNVYICQLWIAICY